MIVHLVGVVVKLWALFMSREQDNQCYLSWGTLQAEEDSCGSFP